ncbi:TPA: cold shock domain-containing protein [Pseudomonas aeruginosa]|nr:cold shock domain-containing protein [Pseudomonas aeruginosa]EKX7272452.1 cold shock domain-containing protein [Pseudomonas aeruginosa]ELD4442846.1 cold shock domain-containing protein [Pseudomonas aeruginosa]ELH7351706.1 cold shock domain-containing protein [Pseudomonas aeruginosa]ELO0955933.1 cold shock domain-containing protein [Pseudomonas aeruginosa]ELO2041997.1 cold shock domain-containing protein [Pseudomonas aeruginosa]
MCRRGRTLPSSHFRQIEASGYQSLGEGQPLSFFVTDETKGPQDEQVQALHRLWHDKMPRIRGAIFLLRLW